MSVKNFWITVDVDGRRGELATGPRRPDGGFTATIYILDEGSVLRALEIRGTASEDGELTLSTWAAAPWAKVSADGHEPGTGFTITTHRDLDACTECGEEAAIHKPDYAFPVGHPFR